MDQNSLFKYLRKGEGENIEFKQTLNSEYKIAKTICSLANTTGGVILVGIKDDKSIVGVDPEEEKHILGQAANFYCDPPIPLNYEEIEEWHDEKDVKVTILKVTIKDSPDKPHKVLNKKGEWLPYFRQQDQSVIAGKKSVSLMKESTDFKGQLSKNEKKLVSYLKRHPKITQKEFMDLVNISERRARRELHEALSKGIIKVMELEKDDYYCL